MKTFIGLVFLAVLSRVMAFVFIEDLDRAATISYMFTPACFDAFGIGAILSYLTINHRERLGSILRSKSYLFIFSFILAITVALLAYYQDYIIAGTVFRRLLTAIFCFWLVGKASGSDFKGVAAIFLENRIVTYLGKISYGLYVYHHFMRYLFTQFKILPFTGIAVFYFIVTVGIAAVSWHLFEYPINNLKKYFDYKTRIKYGQKIRMKPSLQGTS